jgi:hypothetical protein
VGWAITSGSAARIFISWYTYDADGRGIWLVTPSGSWTGATELRGTLYQTDGPGYQQPFDPARVNVRIVGEAAFSFRDAANATFSYTLNGTTGSKPIQRLRF